MRWRSVKLLGTISQIYLNLFLPQDLMKQMDLRNDQLEEKALAFEEQYKSLEQMVEPFKEQLESFELEKNSLLSKTEASQEEVRREYELISYNNFVIQMNKLASQYSSLLGHQNHKQKIHHVQKLKQENMPKCRNSELFL